ncbi:MAG: chromosome segregation protein SMC [Kiritimatiellae bacterium]|nr:chromosome segregation protein SMC [Kiritimatiellia bacterium]
MYLKQLDILGFKSFADKTRLTFEPGMIAIVGPNGCGKSNVSDAIRWVLGEQRPTALRCTKLADVVFNGTDTRKPLGLCEVSITFADCEKELGTEYDEVTITRRVYRDGSGEYFINKVRCGLKDVKRLFMGTGIGTTSYSVMAQGQIDQILSSKPEDRRAVFEEAAGITKFKADRKEAIRKIEQTEQNLLREADVLREMKRQIGSLQRQVGKAQRYKELRDEVRGLDIYVSRNKIRTFDLALELNAAKRVETDALIEESAGAVAAAEEAARRLHQEIHAAEERLGALASEAAAAEAGYRRAQEMIAVNTQRISEYKSFSDRDGREIADARRLLEEAGMQLDSLEQKAALLESGLESALADLDAAQAVFDESQQRIDALRLQLQSARSESAVCDRQAAEIRDTIARLEYEARESILKKERLSSESAQLKDSVAAADANLQEVLARLEAAQSAEMELTQSVAEKTSESDSFREEVEQLRANFGKMQAEAAAKEAELNYLNDAQDAAAAFSAGAQALLEGRLGLPDGSVLGSLAERFDAPAEYRIALEAALRSWLDAVVVKDGSSAALAVEALVKGEAGSARIICLEGERKVLPKAEGLTRLIDVVKVDESFLPAAEALIGAVYVVEDAAALHGGLPEGASALVSKNGVVYGSNGTYEVWQPGTAAASPLSRKMLVTEAQGALAVLLEKIENGERTLSTASEKSARLAEELRNLQERLSEARRVAAQAQGEYTSLERDANQLKARLDFVGSELQSVLAANADGDARRESLAVELESTVVKRDALLDETAQKQDELMALETGNAEKSRILTEKRVAAGQMESELEFTSRQKEDVERRKSELYKTVEGRENGIKGYQESIARLTDETIELQESLLPLQEKFADVRARTEDERANREALNSQLSQADAEITTRRNALDGARDTKAKLEVASAESTMLRQNLYDHLSQEYGLDAQQVMREPDPEFKGDPPPAEVLEAKVNDINAKIAALGPVNMVAIDEFRELEERYTREKEQEADLLAAKAQIMELIADLNGKSGEMFKATFEKANENFQKMFTKLFNGGEARLVLLENEQDPLECGIDIIARPPGKRPQSVTLLSGGERTMTAVALLFAIFRIKPAPFTMLDELDAALDDANIGRFVDALKEFLDRSQFLIITHNQHTIAGSDIVYGVSQQEKGVSRVISMKLSDLGAKKQ